MQFVLTEERAQVVGDMAWVSVDENLLGDQSGATIAAINIFVRSGVRQGIDGWRLVCHHGSVVNHSIVGETPARRPEPPRPLNPCAGPLVRRQGGQGGQCQGVVDRVAPPAVLHDQVNLARGGGQLADL